MGGVSDGVSGIVSVSGGRTATNERPEATEKPTEVADAKVLASGRFRAPLRCSSATQREVSNFGKFPSERTNEQLTPVRFPRPVTWPFLFCYVGR